jgi:phthalate 4,5-cis-dihydrodiol dehydrogenase
VRTIAIGVAGLGRAFSLMAPSFAADPRVRLVAAADPRPEAQQRFESEFSGAGYASVEELVADPGVEVVYIATPHEFHARQACLAASRGKHILVEKPMALTLSECSAMIAAGRQGNVHLVVGHSHSFDAPIRRTRELIASGAFGRLRMITAVNFTDFLYRPRRPEELDTARGGGAVYNQAAHHVDVVRLLAGGLARSVRAATGAWDAARPADGAYSAFLAFEDGSFASLTYSGYAHFDSDELCGWIGESGQRKGPGSYGVARRRLAADELQQKNALNYGGAQHAGTAAAPAPALRLSDRFVRARRPAAVARRGDDLLRPREAPRAPDAAHGAALCRHRRTLRCPGRGTPASAQRRPWKWCSRSCALPGSRERSRYRARFPCLPSSGRARGAWDTFPRSRGRASCRSSA